MSWYYHISGVNHGPVELPELKQLRAQDQITADTLVWTEGMAQWEPFQSSRAGGALTASPALAAMGSSTAQVTQTCVECGQAFPQDEMLNYEGSWVCAKCKPLFFQRIKEGVTPLGVLHYASVGKRFLAVFIDGILLDIVILVPVFLILGTTSVLFNSKLATSTQVLVMLFQYAIPIAYEIYFIGRYGATLGKMALKVKVVQADGSPLSYGRATGRYFAKILSGLILLVGYLMAFWDPEKRALHDRLCETRVIDTSR